MMVAYESGSVVISRGWRLLMRIDIRLGIVRVECLGRRVEMGIPVQVPTGDVKPLLFLDGAPFSGGTPKG